MALDFDGASDWINLRAGGSPLDAVNGDASSTIMGWFQLDDLANDDLFGYSINNGGAPSSATRMGIDRNASNNMRSEWAAPDGTTGASVGAWVMTVGAPQKHFASMVSVVGDTVRQFMNGILQEVIATAFAPAAFDATSSASGGIMAEPDGSGDESDGLAEDCRIYARLLTDDMIATIHVCRGHDGIWDSIRARFPMQEGAPGVAASGAGSIKDWSNPKRNGDQVSGPIYAESRLSLRRRYL